MEMVVDMDTVIKKHSNTSIHWNFGGDRTDDELY